MGGCHVSFLKQKNSVNCGIDVANDIFYCCPNPCLQLSER